MQMPVSMSKYAFNTTTGKYYITADGERGYCAPPTATCTDCSEPLLVPSIVTATISDMPSGCCEALNGDTPLTNPGGGACYWLGDEITLCGNTRYLRLIFADIFVFPDVIPILYLECLRPGQSYDPTWGDFRWRILSTDSRWNINCHNWRNYELPGYDFPGPFTVCDLAGTTAIINAGPPGEVYYYPAEGSAALPHLFSSLWYFELNPNIGTPLLPRNKINRSERKLRQERLHTLKVSRVGDRLKRKIKDRYFIESTESDGCNCGKLTAELNQYTPNEVLENIVYWSSKVQKSAETLLKNRHLSLLAPFAEWKIPYLIKECCMEAKADLEK